MVGGLNAELRTNEDTDFCRKLLSAGARCHNTKSHGAVIFQGDHGTAAASSITKRFGPGQRARYFKHILDSKAKTLATDSNTQAWLWKRYLKMAARALATTSRSASAQVKQNGGVEPGMSPGM